MVRDLALFLDHTNQHVIEEIKKTHPEWVEADGACQPCVEYYRKAMSGDTHFPNIGPRGRRRRLMLGTALAVLSAGIAAYFNLSHAPLLLKVWLFPPIFMATLCLIQAREKTCAVLATAGYKNMDDGEEKIEDVEIAKALRARGRKIFILSTLIALTVTLSLLMTI